MALLEHADADQIETLLEPAHLLVVLQRCGRDLDDVKGRLVADEPPGQLLLELFEEGRSADELLALMPPGALERTRARSVARGDHEEAPLRRADLDPSLKLTALRRPAIVAWFAALTVPAMLASGSLPEWALSPTTATAVAVVLAMISGALVAEERALRIAGAVSGLIGAPGAVWLSYLWLSLRDQALRLELALAVALGALPGMVIFLVAYLVHQRGKGA